MPNSIAVSNAQESLRALTTNFAMVPTSLVGSGYMSGITTYAALEIFAGSGESPSLSALSRATGLTRPTVRKARDWLVAEGYIQIDQLGNGRITTRYTLTGGLYPRGKEFLPQGSNNFTPHVPVTVTVTVTVKRVTVTKYLIPQSGSRRSPPWKDIRIRIIRRPSLP